jgi:hypothetical protein
MAMTLVSSVAVGSGGAASIEFTSIPSTGKDLLVVLSGRMESLSGGNLDFLINGDTASNYNWRYIRGNGSSISIAGTSSWPRGTIEEGLTGTGDTSNTFSSVSFYLSNYASTAKKSISVDMVNENDGTEAYQLFQGFGYNGTSAVTSLKFYLTGGTDLAQYSMASLYIIS